MSERILLIASAPLDIVSFVAKELEKRYPEGIFTLLILESREEAAAARLPSWEIRPYRQGNISPWNTDLLPFEKFRPSAANGVFYVCNDTRPGEYINVELLARCINADNVEAVVFPMRTFEVKAPEEAVGLLRAGELARALKYMEEFRKSKSIEYAVRSTVSAIPPGCATIFTSPACNFRCAMCGFHDGLPHESDAEMLGFHTTGKKEMELEDYVRLIDEMADMGVESMAITGAGEPLLDPNTPEIVRHIRRRGVQCNITTNGSLLNRSLRELLISSGVKSIRISFNAGSASTYSHIHNVSKGTFEKVQSNIKSLVKERDSAGIGWPMTGMSFVISKANIHEVDSMLSIAGELGVDWVDFSTVWFRISQPTPGLELTDDDEAMIKEKLCSFKAGADYTGKPVINLAADKWAADFDLKDYYFKNPCYMGWYQTIVTSFGNVLPCCGCHAPMGNILERPFTDIWNGPEYIKLREEMLALPERKRSIRDCSCFEVCPHIIWNENMRRKVKALAMEEARCVLV